LLQVGSVQHGSGEMTHVLLLLLLCLPLLARGSSCPSSPSHCPCYNFEDGLFLECPGATVHILREVLQQVAGPVQSLSIYDLDAQVTVLQAELFPPGALIRHLQISHSSLAELADKSLIELQHGLESLSLVSGRLKQVPQKALSGLKELRALDLEANEITDLPSYSVYGLNLSKLNLKGNLLQKTSEYAFAGLEGSLTELDLAENKLQSFPMAALRRLEHLRSLRMAWNEIGDIPDDGYSRLGALLFLDLSSNNFETVPSDCFHPMPALRTLSLYYNSVETVQHDAFVSLLELESVDLSHNKIVFLDGATFQTNKKLRTVDLSHNHIHYISGVFAGLPELRELFLSENNILELPADAFTDSALITVIYLQQNAIRRVDPEALLSLPNLAQLHLSSNFIRTVPRDWFATSQKLTSLSLDGNWLEGLEPGTFRHVNSLRELRLQHNRLEEIERGVFDPLPALLELHLQNNLISSIESGAFRSLQSLQHVNLQVSVSPRWSVSIATEAEQSNSYGSCSLSSPCSMLGFAVFYISPSVSSARDILVSQF
jgi:Leucine-rich repeat (LRR) protein